MKLAKQTAKHLREVYFGGNWTASNFKEQLAKVHWEDATKSIHGFNSIAVLANHINYYVHSVLPVFKGKPLNSKDELSFTHPPINTEKDWLKNQEEMWADAEKLIAYIERLDDDIFWTNFTKEEYGNYYRNLQGIVEHTHYHLGQIVIINKLINATK